MRIVTLCILVVACKGTAQSTAVADSLYATGNYTQAINTYATVGNTASNLQIARAYNAIGNYDKAIAQYEAVVTRDSDLRIARLELGKLYLKTKRYDDARKIFSKLVADDETNPEYFYYQGEAFRELEQFSSGLVAYKKAIKIDSTHLRSLFQLGKYFVVKQENLQALEYIEKGLAFYPNDVALINLKALAHYNNNDYESALPEFERLVALGETKEHIYTKLADCYRKEWQFEKAKKTYRILLELDEENYHAYFGLGGVYVRTKQLDSAEINYKMAIAVQEPVLAMEYEALAHVARQKEDLKSALEYYKLAFAENSNNIHAYYNICTIADQYYEDPKVRLAYYEEFQQRFRTKPSYFTEIVEKRIRALTEEIHFADN